MHPIVAVNTATTPPPAGAPRPPRLLDRLLDALRARDCSLAMEQAYVTWIERYLHYHRPRHHSELDEADVAAFLSHLVRTLGAAPSEQSQAFAALLLFYREVLRRDLEWCRVITRVRRSGRSRHPARRQVAAAQPRPSHGLS